MTIYSSVVLYYYFLPDFEKGVSQSVGFVFLLSAEFIILVTINNVF